MKLVLVSFTLQWTLVNPNPVMHLSMISPIPPTWGGVGGMWGLGHTICAPWWGKVQMTPIDCLGVKVQLL